MKLFRPGGRKPSQSIFDYESTVKDFGELAIIRSRPKGNFETQRDSGQWGLGDKDWLHETLEQQQYITVHFFAFTK